MIDSAASDEHHSKQISEPKRRLYCGALLVLNKSRPTAKALAKAKFCSPNCFGEAKRGKTRAKFAQLLTRPAPR